MYLLQVSISSLIDSSNLEILSGESRDELQEPNNKVANKSAFEKPNLRYLFRDRMRKIYNLVQT